MSFDRLARNVELFQETIAGIEAENFTALNEDPSITDYAKTAELYYKHKRIAGLHEKIAKSAEAELVQQLQEDFEGALGGVYVKRGRRKTFLKKLWEAEVASEDHEAHEASLDLREAQRTWKKFESKARNDARFIDYAQTVTARPAEPGELD